MDAGLFNGFPFDAIAALAGAFPSDILFAGLIFAATALLIALCVPGIIVPTAVTTGAVIGAWPATAAVALGALAGSQLFFLFSRRLARERVRARLGGRLEAFQHKFAAHGLWYVIGLRLVGAPHFLVTAGSALMPMRSTSFAAATLLGLLPVIAVAAAAGSAI